MRSIPIVSLRRVWHGISGVKRDDAPPASPPMYLHAAIPTAGFCACAQARLGSQRPPTCHGPAADSALLTG